MKYGVVPTNLLERAALWTGQIPVPVLDCVFSILKARALMTAVKLGIFEALREGARTADDIATELGLDRGCLDLLMRSLVVMDYLEQDDDCYTLAPIAERSLTKGSTQELVGFVLWNEVHWEMVAELDVLVRTGRGVDFHQTMSDPQRWGHYQQAMLELARISAPVVAKRVPVPKGAKRLLDLAGGHGLFGAAICQAHPPLRATVIDLPDALPHARRLAAAEGHADIVDYREGHLLTSDYGTDFDVALLFNILHHFRPGDIAAILTRARHALRPGATIAIWETEAPRKGTAVHAGDVVSLFFRLSSTAGAYHGDQFAAWLSAAGFAKIRQRRPLASPGEVLVTAVRT